MTFKFWGGDGWGVFGENMQGRIEGSSYVLQDIKTNF